MSDPVPTTLQRDTMDVADCTCANLRKAARVVTQAFDAALQPTGLKATQFTLLATLSRQGDAPLTRLADALVMDRTTLTRNLKPLVRKGLVRIEHETDQRVRRVGLTEAGQTAYEAAHAQWRQAQARILEGLGPERWAGFREDLTAMVSVLRSA